MDNCQENYYDLNAILHPRSVLPTEWFIDRIFEHFMKIFFVHINYFSFCFSRISFPGLTFMPNSLHRCWRSKERRESQKRTEMLVTKHCYQHLCQRQSNQMVSSLKHLTLKPLPFSSNICAYLFLYKIGINNTLLFSPVI